MRSRYTWETTTEEVYTMARDTATSEVIPFRYPTAKKRQLEALRLLRGDESLSDTIREAVDRFLSAELPHFTSKEAA